MGTKKQAKPQVATPVKKAAPVKAAAPAKVAAPVKKAAPAKAAAPAKVAAPVKKAAPVKAATPAKVAAPVKKAAPVKAAAPAKVAAPVKKAAPVKAAAPAKKAAPVKAASVKAAAPAKDKILKVGIIGVGTIGSVHTDAYTHVTGAKVVALCDILADRLAEKAKRHNIEKTYLNYKDLLADPEIDAVDVCVPNDMHAPIAIDAFKAGKHVLLEKPMTLNADWGKKILAARDAAGKILQMGMVWRQTPEAEVVKEAIEAGRLGEVYQIRVKLIRRRGIPGLGGWFTTKAKSGGGGLIDIAVHFLDLVMWVTGYWNPTKVSAKVYSKFGDPISKYHYVGMWAGPPKMDGTFDVDDYAAGFIRFGKKATLSFEVAWACNAADESYVEFLGDKGGCKCGENTGLTTFRTEVGDRPADVVVQYDPNRDRFAAEIQKFVNAIKGKGVIPATGEEGLATMKLLDAIYKSSSLDKEVDVKL